MSSVPTLLQLAALRAALDAGDTPCAQITQVMEEVATLGRNSEPVQRAALLAGVCELERSLERAMAEIATKLQAAGNKRVALGRYGSLRAHQSGQNLRRRV